MNTSVYSNDNRKVTVWAIFAGVLAALGTEVTLNFLGIGLGLASINMSADNLFKAGIGAVIWLSLTGVIAMAFGGWITGKLTYCSCIKTRALYGFLAWCLATLITVLVTASTAGAMIGGPANIVKSSIVSVGQKCISATAQYANSSDTATSNENTVSDRATKEASDNLGKASIAIFFAFLLSAVAGTLGARYAAPLQLPHSLSKE